MKMSKMRIAAVAAISAAALALAACSGGASSNPTSASPAATPTEGGDLTILVASSMTTWDPGASTGSFPGVQWDRLYAVYGALLSVKTDNSVDYGFADSLETDDGGATWTLKLKSGLRFTDGAAYDADAVKQNFDHFADPANKLGAKAVAGLFTSKVVDDTTLTLTVTGEKDPVLDIQIANAIPFVASPSSLPAAGATLTTPVGAGPFTLEKWDTSVGETFKKNADYYQTGKPYLDTLTFSIVADPAQRVSTVAAGGAQIMNGYPFQWIADKDSSSVGVAPVESGGIRHLVFNMKSDLFSDVRARQAVQLAIDPSEMVQTLTQDPSAEGSTALFPESSPFYDSSLSLPEQDADKAQSLVDEVKGEGKDFTIKLLVAAVPELVRAGELLQLTLQKLDGVTVDLTQIPIADWRAQAYDKDDFDITFYPGVFDLNSPQVGMASLFGDGGLDNFANFSDSDMTAALNEAQSATSQDDLVAAMKKVQQIYVDDIPIVVFGIDYRSFFHTSDVVGFQSMGRGALYTDRLGYQSK